MGNSCMVPLFQPKKKEGDFQYNLVQTFAGDSFQDDFTIVDERPLGEGITGSVYHVVSKVTSESFAMKSINLSRFNKAQLKELENEIDLVRSLDHTNIIKIHKVYKSKRNIFIIMELLTGGELSSRFPRKPSQVAKVAVQLLSACRYWHSRNIVHRDLKLENIMYTDKSPDAAVKVIDFGLGTWYAVNHNSTDQFLQQYTMSRQASKAGSVAESPKNEAEKRSSSRGSNGGSAKRIRFAGSRRTDSVGNNSASGSQTDSTFKKKSDASAARLKRIMMSQVGTAYFMAPELSNEKGYDQSVDLWAIGVIIYMMITRKEPFGGQSEKEIFGNAVRGKPSYDSPNWARMSPHAKDLVQNLLQVDASKRWTAEEALKSPWLSSYEKKKRKGEGEDEDFILEREVVSSFQRFVKYTRLKRAALMVIAHKTSSEKLCKLRDAFFEMDIYRTGTLTLDELRIVLERHGVIGEQVDTLFQDLDQDRSGHIRYMEFLAATIETQKFISEGELADAFDHLDTDRSGFITKKNLKQLLGKVYSDEEIEQIIKESDLTGDNQVSKAEFMEVMRYNQNKIVNEVLLSSDRSDASQTEQKVEVKGEKVEIPVAAENKVVGC